MYGQYYTNFCIVPYRLVITNIGYLSDQFD